MTRPEDYARRRHDDAARRSQAYDREVERALKAPPRRTGVAPHLVRLRGEVRLRTGADHLVAPGDRIMVDDRAMLVTGYAGMRSGFNVWFVVP